MKLLLDTNFIVAYILPNDSLHCRSIKLEESKNIVSNECYVTNQVITEVMNILSQKDSVGLAIKTYNMMNDSFICINEYDIPNFNDRVISNYKMLNKFEDKLNSKHDLGFTDCTILTVANYYNLDGIVSFDEGFLGNGLVNIIC